MHFLVCFENFCYCCKTITGEIKLEGKGATFDRLNHEANSNIILALLIVLLTETQQRAHAISSGELECRPLQSEFISTVPVYKGCICSKSNTRICAPCIFKRFRGVFYILGTLLHRILEPSCLVWKLVQELIYKHIKMVDESIRHKYSCHDMWVSTKCSELGNVYNSRWYSWFFNPLSYVITTK